MKWLRRLFSRELREGPQNVSQGPVLVPYDYSRVPALTPGGIVYVSGRAADIFANPVRCIRPPQDFMEMYYAEYYRAAFSRVVEET